MSLTIHNNILMMNAQHQYKVNAGNKATAMERLSSGYRINRAADDAANLTISEKMRLQIRGLNQGTLNAQDGVSWVQIGDGSLNELHDMIHRMNELTIKSLNGTNTDADRAAMQLEFDQLQSEIDRLTNTTQFNTKQVFSEHEIPYYQFVGNIEWSQSQRHVINDGENDLVIEYRMEEGGPVKQAAITVPSGEYTTQELMDEIDDAFTKAGFSGDGLVMEFTAQGTCNMNLEGGAKIEEVTGGLSYLLYDTYEGGSLGALIGTTVFPSEFSKLPIVTGKNDELSFSIEGTDGSSVIKSLKIPAGNYTRSQLIDLLNAELSDTTVVAVKSGTGIKLASDDSIITGFKGNMFQIDVGNSVYTSVFYDNVKNGTVTMHAGYFVGGAVIPTDSRDTQHQKYRIDSSNQELRLQPNGSTTPTTLTIPEGAYTVNEMVTKLNDLFAANALKLNATVYTSGKFQGIRIDSRIEGADSSVGIDTSSSAYETLFVKKTYNTYRADAVIDRETTANKTATYTGGKSFTGSNIPFTVTSGVNDSFVLSLDGAEYTITLDAGTYQSASELAAQLNSKFSDTSAPIGYKDKIAASVYSGALRISEANGSHVAKIRASASGTNQGYEQLFVGKNVTYTSKTASGTGSSGAPASVTLNTPVTDPTTLDSSNNQLKITLDGTSHTVTLPTGSNVTHNDITNAINTQIPQGTTTSDNVFSDVAATGSTSNYHFSSESQGRTSIDNTPYQNRGSADIQQGVAGGYTNNVPAKVTMRVSLPATMVIDDSNNQFQITLNDQTKSFSLTNGTYSRSQLVTELQKKIDANFTQYFGGATVSLDSANRLVFTSRLKYSDGTPGNGQETYIACDALSSSFLKELHTTETAAKITTNRELQSMITIDNSSNIFSFRFVDAGVDKNVNLTLTSGTYNRTGIVDEINRQLNAGGYGITASLSSNKLVMTTNAKGDGNEIYLRSQTGGSSMEALFGDLVVDHPASAVANQQVQSSVTIDASSDKLKLNVDGTDYAVTLDHGTYTRDSLITQINTKFAAAGAGITASLDGNKIRYTTDSKGSSASFKVTYADGGSAMKAIYGQTTTTHEGVTAEFTSDGKLKLTRTGNGGTISVSSSGGSVFQQPIRNEQMISPSYVNGYYSTKKAYIDGVNITEPVVIDQWNNQFRFTFCDEGVSRIHATAIDEGSYTFASLKQKLQEKLDTVAGSGKLAVSVSGAGVRIEVVKPGNINYITNFSGGFYDKVLCSAAEKTERTSPQVHNGTQANDTAFVVGRKDVRNGTTEIKAGVNDSLSLDFTYGGVVHKISMDLDAGKYSGNALKNEIQKKLNEKLVALGLEENTIEVGIGGINTGVVGANDQNALNFKLSNTVKLPTAGTYIIDGVSGTAAFSVFYQTDGDIALAYVKGTKDISGGVTIENGKTDFSFDADGTSYSIQIPEGTYSKTEILDKMNELLKDAGAPVNAEIEDHSLKLVYKKYGKHKITNLSGGAKSALFFQENGMQEEEEKINLQFSSVTDDHIELDRPVLNTVSLGINSIAITRPKYARKALERLEKALDRVSEVRSYFGSMQNRLEHTIRNNENKSENTQAAESRIRDADMAKEMLENSKRNILEQSIQAMMAQANSSQEGILRLFHIQ